MKIMKEFKGDDNQIRRWVYDTDLNYVFLQAYAKDFQGFTINKTQKSAQELLDEVDKE